MNVLSEFEVLGQNEERVRTENRRRRDELLAKIKSGQETTGRRLLDYALVWSGNLEQALRLTVFLETLEALLAGQRGQLILIVDKTTRLARGGLWKGSQQERRRFFLGQLTEERLTPDFAAFEPRWPTARHARLTDLNFATAISDDPDRFLSEGPHLVEGNLVPSNWFGWPMFTEVVGRVPALYHDEHEYHDPVIVIGNQRVAEYFAKQGKVEQLAKMIELLGLPFEQFPADHPLPKK